MFSRNASPKAGPDDGTLAVVDEAPEPEQLESAGASATGDAEPLEPWWSRWGSTEEEAAAQIANLDSLRGRQANELGALRSENEHLRALLDEEGGAAGSPVNGAALLAELDARFIAQLESLAANLAGAIEHRVHPLETKVEALIGRFAQEGPHA